MILAVALIKVRVLLLFSDSLHKFLLFGGMSAGMKPLGEVYVLEVTSQTFNFSLFPSKVRQTEEKLHFTWNMLWSPAEECRDSIS